MLLPQKTPLIWKDVGRTMKNLSEEFGMVMQQYCLERCIGT